MNDDPYGDGLARPDPHSSDPEASVDALLDAGRATAHDVAEQ